MEKQNQKRGGVNASSASSTISNIPSGIIVGAHNSNEEKNSENAPITITTMHLLPYENRGRGRGRNFGKGEQKGNNGASGRSNFKHPGEFDAYCMNVAPLNIFKNQVVLMGLHNFSKTFNSNVATTRVISLGMKFIFVWKKIVIKNLFAGFKEFRGRMTSNVF